MGWTGQDMPQALGLWCVYIYNLLLFRLEIVNIPAFPVLMKCGSSSVVLICGDVSTSKFYQKNEDESVA